MVDALIVTLMCGAAGFAPRPPVTGMNVALARPVPPLRHAIERARLGAPLARQNAIVRPGRRDSIWNGLLIGAGIGGAGGYVWARQQCGSNDPECSAIANPVGILGGAAIGAAVGAILDAFS